MINIGKWTVLIVVTGLFLFRTSSAAAIPNANASTPLAGKPAAQKQEEDWYSFVETEVKAGRGKAQVPSLIAAIDGVDTNKRTLAAQLISLIGKDASDAVPSLIRHVNDRNFDSRLRCIEALGDIGQASFPAIPSLINALNDPYWVITNMAAYSLGGIGPQAQSAVPALEAVLKRPKDSNRYATVAVTCRVALSRITGKQGVQVMALIAMLKEKDDEKNANWPAFEATRGLGRLMPASKIALSFHQRRSGKFECKFQWSRRSNRGFGNFWRSQLHYYSPENYSR